MPDPSAARHPVRRSGYGRAAPERTKTGIVSRVVVTAAVVPPDLAAALQAEPRAQAFFDTLDRSNRYAVLWRVHTARRPETRARRIAEFVAMLARHENIHAD